MFIKKQDKSNVPDTFLYRKFNQYYSKLLITAFLISLLILVVWLLLYAQRHPDGDLVYYAVNKAIRLCSLFILSFFGKKAARRTYFNDYFNRYLKEKNMTVKEFSEATYVYHYDYDVEKDGKIILDEYAMRKFSQYLEEELAKGNSVPK